MASVMETVVALGACALGFWLGYRFRGGYAARTEGRADPVGALETGAEPRKDGGAQET